MTYFNKCENLDELRAEYRRLIKLHHPDVGTRQTLRPLATGKKLLTKSAASTARNFLRAQAAPL